MIVFAYNFPHWKTQMGLINMAANGFIPSLVVLQDKKRLTIPVSDYRVTPKGDYLINSVDVCNMLGMDYIVMDHDDYPGSNEMGVILGARILTKGLIERMPKGILNIHPGILPGNRGLDNLKHSITKRLPIGVTAHLIDHRIDMGTIIATAKVPVYHDDDIRDVYIRQRNTEQRLLIDVLKADKWDGKACTFSEKFTAVPEHIDIKMHHLFKQYKDIYA